MARPRGDYNAIQSPCTGWARMGKFSPWLPIVRGGNWREAWLALAAAVAHRDLEDQVDLQVTLEGESPKEGMR